MSKVDNILNRFGNSIDEVEKKKYEVKAKADKLQAIVDAMDEEITVSKEAIQEVKDVREESPLASLLTEIQMGDLLEKQFEGMEESVYSMLEEIDKSVANI